ncbi:hypothetical protein PLICRDRAFT_173653 [Plicaturopsis crispa FD-325 SS-3]|nr:hypothetical protein PLICRDRAFT_173653 [Plicaturopsis crispa FD-325 SS-3]
MSSKRPRTDSNAAPAPPTRSDIWMEDGTIVLEAETTQFRVHRSVLRANSAIFADMFEVCGSAEEPDSTGGSSELVEGCPVIHMPDQSQDWQHVLKALYDRGYCANSNEPMSLDIASAFLRLGKKYKFIHIYKEALSRLHLTSPTTLAQWDAHSDGIIYTVPETLTLVMQKHTIIVSLINLARSTDTRSILPAAFYRYCATAFQETVLDGYHKRDPSLASVSSRDRDICISGHTALLRAQIKHVYPWAELEKIMKPECNVGECNRIKIRLLTHCLQNCFALAQQSELWLDPLCGLCRLKAKRCMAAGRQKIWDELPSFFDLPSWETLIAEDALEDESS